MTKHRRPPDSVSDDIHPDNPEPPSPEPPNRGASAPEPSTLEAPTPEVFDPGEALQRLYLDLVDIEAIANAANEAVVQLPFPADREARRVFNRVYTLVSKVADESSSAIDRGNQLMAQLAVHLARRKKTS
jgi:hypothetical protein